MLALVRVRMVVSLFQRGDAVVGVLLCRCQRRVPQQHLYLPNVGASLEQMRGERVPQYVRTAFAGDPVLRETASDGTVNRDSGYTLAFW